MLASGSITVVVVCIVVTCSYIFGEVHIRLPHRVCGYAIPYGLELMQKYNLALTYVKDFS